MKTVFDATKDFAYPTAYVQLRPCAKATDRHGYSQQADAQTANEAESKVTYLSTADAALSCCNRRTCNWLIMNKMQRISVDFFDVIVRQPNSRSDLNPSFNVAKRNKSDVFPIRQNDQV